MVINNHKRLNSCQWTNMNYHHLELTLNTPSKTVVYVHRLDYAPICFTCSIVSITLCTRASCQLYIRVEKKMKNFRC
jgi:hypothetical protein